MSAESGALAHACLTCELIVISAGKEAPAVFEAVHQLHVYYAKLAQTEANSVPGLKV